jgi:hydrogenase maturation protease
MASSPEVQARIVGLGNVILGDEGVGVHVARFLAESGRLPEGVDCLDGGTGGLAMLGLLQTTRRLRPRFARDFPPSLAAHDIGLKDLLDSFYLLGDAPPDVVLFTVSIPAAPDLGMDLSPEVASAVPVAAERVLQELAGGPRGR